MYCFDSRVATVMGDWSMNVSKTKLITLKVPGHSACYCVLDYLELGGDSILTNSAIEMIANDTIKRLAAKHPLLDPEIKDHDKYMTYDGSIMGFKRGGQNFSKENWEFTVPIQIKGHRDLKNTRKSKYISKDVDLADLHIYYSEHGVLYFEVLMDENGDNEEIFFAQLTQSKAKGYLETAAKKKNKSSIRVQFIKLQKTPEALYRILKQFAYDSKKQNKQLADDTIKLKDLQKVQEFSITVFDAKNEIDILKKIVDGEVCLFGKIQGNPYDLPIEWKKNGKLTVTNKQHNMIYVGDTAFYDNYRIKETSDGEIFLYPSDNLEINLTNSRFHFDLKTNLHQMYQDAKFLLAILNNTKLIIVNHEITYSDPNMPQNLQERLKYIIDLYETLDMIGFDVDFKLSELSQMDIKELTFLVNIRLGKYNEKLTSDINRYLWHYQGKCVPLLIIKNGEKSHINEIVNAMYTTKYQTFASVENTNDTMFITPLFIYYNAEILANLYRYDYEFFYEQVDKTDINKYTLEVLNLEVLKLINVFDIIGDEHFLQIADYLLKKLENFHHLDHFIMNRLQIKKRLGVWGDDELAELESMSNDSVQGMFGKAVLIENKEEAEKYFESMDSVERDIYRGYPIYRLYEDLQNK